MITSPPSPTFRHANASPPVASFLGRPSNADNANLDSSSIDAIQRVIFGPQLQLLRDEVSELQGNMRREFDALRTSVQRRFEEFEARIAIDLAQAQQQGRDVATRTLRAALTSEAEQASKPNANLAAVEETLRDEIAMSAAEVSRQFRTLLDERLEEHFGAEVGREQIAHAMELMLMRDNVASTKLMESIQ